MTKTRCLCHAWPLELQISLAPYCCTGRLLSSPPKPQMRSTKTLLQLSRLPPAPTMPMPRSSTAPKMAFTKKEKKYIPADETENRLKK